MDIIFVIVISIFILILLSSIILISLNTSPNKPVNISQEVKISVIISVKNEKEKIKDLVDNLNNLTYPQSKYEIILVNDNSTDGTLEEMKMHTTGLNNFSVIDLTNTKLKGKREALTIGIEHSQFPYILITDADCKPKKDWLGIYSAKFESDCDLLFGIAPFYQNESLVNKISCFEQLRSSLLSFSMARLGLPFSAAARNFGFTKKAFKAIEGYSNTKDTLSGDDDLLLREAVKRKLKICSVTEPGSFVYSETKKTFKEYLQQRARHTQTSFHYLKKHQFILGFWHLLNLMFLFSPLLIFVNVWFAMLFPAKLIIDFITIKSTQNKFGYKFLFTEIFYLQIFYELLLVVHFINARFSEIKWK